MKLMSAGCFDLSGERFARIVRMAPLALLAAALLAFAAPSSYAQVSTARIDGFVRDASGAVVPGAAVTLKDVATGYELHATTDASGFYDFEAIPPKADYTLTVSMKGFATFSQPNLAIHADDRLEIPITLKVATQVQEVQVSASAVPLVTTDSGAKTDVIGANEIQNLSTIGRSAVELLTLLPGVVNSGYNPLMGTTFGGNGVESFNVNGLRNDMNDVRLDSAHMIDPGCNCGNIIEPNMDMIQEFSVKTSNFEADQGRSAMIVDTVLKSGGAHVHGEAYWYTRNSIFNANDWSNNYARYNKANNRFNYPGFNLGGPVRLPHSDFNKNNDKMFFFFSAEWQKQLPDPGTELATVPSLAMRALAPGDPFADFSELLSTKNAQGNLLCTSNGKGGYNGRALSMPCDIEDPNNWGGSPITSNMIPADGVNGTSWTGAPTGWTTQGQILLNEFPLPNYVDPNGQYNYAGRPLYRQNRNEQSARIDYNLRDNLRAYVHLARNADHQFYPFGLWSGENSGWTSNVPEPSPTLGNNSGESVVLNVVHVINPTLTNEVQFNVQALNLPNHYADPSKLSKSAQGLNFSGMTFFLPNDPFFATPHKYTGDFFPQINDRWAYGPGGGGNPGLGRWGEGDVGNGIFADKTEFEWLDNLTKVHGTHTMKFGFAADHTRNDQNGGPYPEGQLITDNWGGMTTGNEFGDIMTEHFRAFNQGVPNRDGLWRFWNIEWYAQDSWKASRRWTLNFGARWSWMQPWYEVRGFATSFIPNLWDPNSTTVALPGGGSEGNFIDGIVTAQQGKISKAAFPAPVPIFQPRLGFALDVFGTGKTILRGGFGVFVTRDQGNIAFYQTTSPPFTFNPSPSASEAPNGSGILTLKSIEGINPFGSKGNLGVQAEDTKDPNQPTTYEWSFTLSQNVGLKTVIEASYVGNTVRHLFRSFNENALPPGTMLIPGSTDCCAKGDTTGQDYTHYQPFSNITLSSHSDTSNYHSLQVTARRNVASGLTVLASYTWSKTLGYTTSFQGVVDPFDSHRNYGLLPWDRSQILNFSYIYKLPNEGVKHFSGSRVAKGVLDGWQLSGITHYTSGAPLVPGLSSVGCHDMTLDLPAGSITNGATGGNNECSNGFFDSGNSRFAGSGVGWYGTPDITLRPLVNWQTPGTSKGVGGFWASANAFSLPGVGKFGTYETPTFRGPGSYNWDATLFKSFPLGEERRLEFRIAAFNFLNHANLLNPAMGTQWRWNMPANLSPTTPNAFSLGTPVLTNGNIPNGFGYISDAIGHREMEFALKLYF